MNKTCSKKLQSPGTEKSVLADCLIPEKSLEHRNGLVNGVVHEPSRVKKHKRGKKTNKKNDKSDSEISLMSEPELLAQVETQEDGSLEQPFCKNDIVNLVINSDKIDKPISKNSKKKSKKLGTLDSNDNISTDVKLQECTSNLEEDLKFLDKLTECEASSSKEYNDFNESFPSSSDALEDVAVGLENLTVTEENEQEKEKVDTPEIKFVQYDSEFQMPMIMKIIQKDLSEPYSIYTYRYFIHNWPKLCFLAMHEEQCVGAIVCKLDLHRKEIKRGYIAMLAVDQNYRKLRIGSTLVQMAINEMIQGDADEVVLETEVTNKPALQLYEKLGFVRDKRLFRYYLNGVDALRLKLWLR